jgi:hypothetical protein
MSTLTLHTGVAFGWNTTITVPFDAEPDAALVYRAANRVDIREVDIARLPVAYQAIRAGIDAASMPSMSAGDFFEVHSNAGHLVAVWTCLSDGWSVRPDYADVESYQRSRHGAAS